MEHIKQFDWCDNEPDVHFILLREVDKCVTEKILRNKFADPLVSSDSEDDSKPKVTLDWDSMFNRNKFDNSSRKVIQGIHPVPPFTKLSALTGQQHYQCLKVLCSQYPDVLSLEFFPRPTKQDHKVFEQVKDIYEKEQKEFSDWAKSLWTSNHCVRALRPKPPIEAVYEAEFKVRAHSLQSFTKTYSMAAQISLEAADHLCELTHQKDIIKVNMSTIPPLQYPDMTKRVTLMKPCPVPEPCTKHPCRFVLPTETAMTLLPMTEVHKELAQFAVDNGATSIASENALRCLMLKNRHWSLPVSVCPALTQDGESSNVVVLGSEFSKNREIAPIRTYKAFKRLLEQTLIPSREATLANKQKDSIGNGGDANDNSKMEISEDEDDNEDNLYIDMAEMFNADDNGVNNDDDGDNTENEEIITEDIESPKINEELNTEDIEPPQTKMDGRTHNNSGNKIDFYNCNCKDTVFEKPAPRSYRRWRARSRRSGAAIDVIVHTPHKARGPSGEVVLEPIPEYQIDLGASEQPQDVVRSMMLGMALRRNTASVLNVRIDSGTGDIVTTESISADDLQTKHPKMMSEIAGRLLAAFDQLQGLRPGLYVLHHEPSHGNNALLFGRASGTAERLSLQFDCSQLADIDEANSLKIPPKLIPTLLPVHKHRRILPCAFTPHPQYIMRESKKPSARQKTPPQAIRWPKRRQRKRKKNNDN